MIFRFPLESGLIPGVTRFELRIFLLYDQALIRHLERKVRLIPSSVQHGLTPREISGVWSIHFTPEFVLDWIRLRHGVLFIPL